MEEYHFTLQGNKLEAFYQLGLSERKRKSSSQIIKKMVLKNKYLSSISEKILGNTLPFPNFLKDEIHQYIEGKGISSDEFKQNFYLADIISSINSISPYSVPSIGCSSALVNDGSLIKHLRILDYPLGPYADEYSSELLFNLDGYNKVFTLTFTDLPFPCLTSINEQGISLALHQRVSSKINIKGSSIFELTSRISLEAKNLDDALYFAKDFNSINNWAIVLVSKEENSGLEIEMVPSGKLIHKKFDLSKKTFAYICNQSLEKKVEKERSFLDSWNFYNSKRCEWVDTLSFDEKVENFFKLPKVRTKTSFSHYTITPASIQSVEIDLTQSLLKKLSTSSVKYDDGQKKKFKLDWSQNAFQNTKEQIKKRKNTPIENFYEAISKCQYYWDQGDKNKSFHYAQLCLTESPTIELSSIATIFYSYFIFSEISNKKILSGQYEKLIAVYETTPDFLKSDCLLLINYYSYYLKYPSYEIDKLEKSHFEILKKNKKIPKFIFKKIFKYLHISRFELFSFGKTNYLIDAVGSP